MEGATTDWTLIIGFGSLVLTVLGTAFYASHRIDALQALSIQRMDALQAESKDFHGRLCALEEKYINFMMRKYDGKD